ncbi:bifunctional diaminohydroxyphosphoribosylaminopyrimidine deaminase/5-amino-6-(5-phosphoribosylamino)uracil reductase RibD [Tianweitania sp. BSSL-BM11]|uniref:Riboflavin biosynthesis protein RibD n=2 Tax=Tianweitania aestuarii TaxID=2814886 RepID=A0ABS5RT10_9HYPH|nr:bifunctional diaminohydroxyphosphoribosylaminopyrimidine deaminase/5-amino-6-(5-phosphoribosylamino)uracil reductase RibD [Tianweitania aestuarii]
MADTEPSLDDRRFMATAIRLSRRHFGLTGTNPSVATLIVADGVIVGRGVTAIGGRPHAETQALAEAGERARGATAYVTLEPCAHHGRTPPCAEALVTAGVSRVVGAASDPDPRVAGRGYAILRAAGIAVLEGVLAENAGDQLNGYLIRSVKRRPEVTLKLAVSADGMIGLTDEGRVAVTGEAVRRQVHLMRAESDAILIGIRTALADDPELTCRLPGLDSRSPIRIVLDRNARLPASAKLAVTARLVPTMVAALPETVGAERRAELESRGVTFLATEAHEGRVALPELMEDLGARGIGTLMVEGGADAAAQFLAEDLVDRLVLFSSTKEIGTGGVRAPITPATVPARFRLLRESRFGADIGQEWVRAH